MSTKTKANLGNGIKHLTTVCSKAKIINHPKRRLADNGPTKHKQSWQLLPAYINRLRTPDPDGHFKIAYLKEAQDDIEPWSVSQIFICPSSTPFAATSALMDHQYVLLIAAGVDANNHTVGLAWGYALTELTYTWSWFFEHLKTALQCNNLKQTFVLVRQKGLIAAFETVFQ